MGQHRAHNEGTIFERTITRKDGTKGKRFTARLPIDEQGKRPVVGTFATKAEARQALKDAQVAQVQGTLVLGKIPTVRDMGDANHDGHAPRRGPGASLGGHRRGAGTGGRMRKLPP